MTARTHLADSYLPAPTRPVHSASIPFYDDRAGDGSTSLFDSPYGRSPYQDPAVQDPAVSPYEGQVVPVRGGPAPAYHSPLFAPVPSPAAEPFHPDRPQLYPTSQPYPTSHYGAGHPGEQYGTARLHLVTSQDASPHRVGLDGSQLLDGQVLYRSSDRMRERGPQADGLIEHRFRYGERPRMIGIAAEQLIAEMELAALTGRGGAHFPVARKWRAVLEAGGGGVVVANGAEGEPASAKDMALLQHRPHLVLDGIAIAVEALGATGAVVWLHSAAVESLRSVHRALAERRAAGADDPPITIVTGPDSYLSGESSAVVRALDGAPVLPAFRRTPAARSGVGGLPTLVQNVETLARVGLLARTGGGAMQPGPLLTVVGEGTLTVVEVPVHTTLGAAAQLGSVSRPLGPGTARAVLVGGFGGRWVPWSQAAEVPLAHLDGRNRPSLGAGIVALAEEDVCGISETAAVVDYLAASSARQCGPCIFGTRELADVLKRIAEGRPRRGDDERVFSLDREIRKRGACGMPDGAVNIALSALETFAADVEAHLAGHPCVHSGQRGILPVPGRAFRGTPRW